MPDRKIWPNSSVALNNPLLLRMGEANDHRRSGTVAPDFADFDLAFTRSNSDATLPIRRLPPFHREISCYR